MLFNLFHKPFQYQKGAIKTRRSARRAAGLRPEFQYQKGAIKRSRYCCLSPARSRLGAFVPSQIVSEYTALQWASLRHRVCARRKIRKLRDFHSTSRITHQRWPRNRNWPRYISGPLGRRRVTSRAVGLPLRHSHHIHTSHLEL